jgi:hypothetical protein
MDPDSPAMNADSVSPPRPNHAMSKGSPVSADPDRTIATTAKMTSMAIWKPTSTNCTCSVVVIPR